MQTAPETLDRPQAVARLAEYEIPARELPSAGKYVCINLGTAGMIASGGFRLLTITRNGSAFDFVLST